MNKPDGDRAQQSQACSPPDAPNERKAEQDREKRQIKARRVVPRNVDGSVGAKCCALLCCTVLLFHGPEFVRLSHLRQKREIPRWRRRRGGPLERAGVPRIRPPNPEFVPASHTISHT